MIWKCVNTKNIIFFSDPWGIWLHLSSLLTRADQQLNQENIVNMQANTSCVQAYKWTRPIRHWIQLLSKKWRNIVPREEQTQCLKKQEDLIVNTITPLHAKRRRREKRLGQFFGTRCLCCCSRQKRPARDPPRSWTDAAWAWSSETRRRQLVKGRPRWGCPRSRC